MKQKIGVRQTQLKDSKGHFLDVIEIDNEFCYAQIALQGGQILKFFSKAQQKDLLWCSAQNSYDQQKALRGGIPLCFPWFGTHATDASKPSHGFARQSIWQLIEVNQTQRGHCIHLALEANQRTLQHWNYQFKLELEIYCQDTLTLNLTVHNQDERSFTFAFAWHSYFAVQAIEKTMIYGLEDKFYIDKLATDETALQQKGTITFAAELDRVYQDTVGPYVIDDGDKRIQIDSPDCQSVIVWNPWQAKAQRLGDIAENAWQNFVCVENGQVAQHHQHLAAGQRQRHQLILQVL